MGSGKVGEEEGGGGDFVCFVCLGHCTAHVVLPPCVCMGVCLFLGAMGVSSKITVGNKFKNTLGYKLLNVNTPSLSDTLRAL